MKNQLEKERKTLRKISKLQKEGYSDFSIIMQLNKRELQDLLRIFDSEYSGKVKENIFKMMLDYYFESIENTIIDLEIEEGIASNNFCDWNGFCCGSSCKDYLHCKGEI